MKTGSIGTAASRGNTAKLRKLLAECTAHERHKLLQAVNVFAPVTGVNPARKVTVFAHQQCGTYTLFPRYIFTNYGGLKLLGKLLVEELGVADLSPTTLAFLDLDNHALRTATKRFLACL